MAASVPATARVTALEQAIHAIPAEWFRPSRAIYWTDLVVSSAVGWGAFAGAVAAGGWRRAALLTVATAALYRAVLFIHEIAHLAPRDVPVFRLGWNALIGVPLMIPSFLYEGVHLDHHRPRSYGTEEDPEYVPYGRRRPALMAVSLALSVLAPAVFAARFAIVAPLSWLVPRLGRATREHASALVINTAYVRRTPLDRAARIEEASAGAVAWIGAGLWWTGRLPIAIVGCWLAVGASASLVNAVRTLAAHRYDNDAGELTMLGQLLDSCTMAPGGRVASWLADACRAAIAPVGLRYHALHHWIPSLPYHNLGRVHRRLVASLAVDAPYRSTLLPGLTPALADLVRRARRQS
jgi:fatty acid desaturase